MSVLTYRIRDVSQTSALEVSRQTPIIPEFGAFSVLFWRSLISLEFYKSGLHEWKHLFRDYRAWCARDCVEDVRKFEGRKEDSPSLYLAFSCFARDELFERY